MVFMHGRLRFGGDRTTSIVPLIRSNGDISVFVQVNGDALARALVSMFVWAYMLPEGLRLLFSICTFRLPIIDTTLNRT